MIEIEVGHYTDFVSKNKRLLRIKTKDVYN